MRFLAILVLLTISYSKPSQSTSSLDKFVNNNLKPEVTSDGKKKKCKRVRRPRPTVLNDGIDEQIEETIKRLAKKYTTETPVTEVVFAQTLPEEELILIPTDLDDLDVETLDSDEKYIAEYYDDTEEFENDGDMLAGLDEYEESENVDSEVDYDEVEDEPEEVSTTTISPTTIITEKMKLKAEIQKSNSVGLTFSKYVMSFAIAYMIL